MDVVSGVVNDLSLVPGLDVTAFFESLGALALSGVLSAGVLLTALPRDIWTVPAADLDDEGVEG